MTVFVVPDDFPLVSLAVASPQVRKGDVIMVKEGVESEVVVVPPEKTGLRIVRDGGEIPEFVEDSGDETGDNAGAENEVGNIDPPGEENISDPEPAETSETSLIEEAEAEDPAEPDDSGEPDGVAEPDDSGEPDDVGEPDDSGEPGDSEEPDDSGEPGDSEEPDDSGEPDDVAEPDGELDDPAPGDDLSSEEERPEDEPGRRPFIMVSRAGGRMVGPGQGSWVIVHRNR